LRHGRISPEQIARMAWQAEGAGQYGLAASLYSLAANEEALANLGTIVPETIRDRVVIEVLFDEATRQRGREIAVRPWSAEPA
jgi:hypothetical protein